MYTNKWNIKGSWSWCSTPHSTIFQLYRGVQFYWWKKREYSEKTTYQEFTLTRRGNELQGKKYCISFCTEDRLADGNQREWVCCPKTAADATLSPSFEPSVLIAKYSDVTDLISAKCCWISKGFVSVICIV
jgi:hypothetical protein